MQLSAVEMERPFSFRALASFLFISGDIVLFYLDSSLSGLKPLGYVPSPLRGFVSPSWRLADADILDYLVSSLPGLKTLGYVPSPLRGFVSPSWRLADADILDYLVSSLSTFLTPFTALIFLIIEFKSFTSLTKIVRVPSKPPSVLLTLMFRSLAVLLVEKSCEILEMMPMSSLPLTWSITAIAWPEVPLHRASRIL